MRFKLSIFIKLLLAYLAVVIVYKSAQHFVHFEDKSNLSQSVRFSQRTEIAERDIKPKRDWHNYKQIELDSLRSGPGEQGKAVILTGKEKLLSDKVFTQNGFCSVVSDKIALDRAIPDIRHHDCRSKLYINNLPSVSIIIPVFEEHWTTLLRSITSIINRAPPNVLKEIILVDDGSFKVFLKEQLDEYCAKNYPAGFIKVLHHEKRLGLITARLTGTEIATGDVLIFLDSHIETSTNWLPPLLEPIALDYRTVVCPFIDVIDMHTFEYRAQDEGARGAFDWILNYKRLPRLPQDQSHPADPFDSPVMAGGLFAISRKFFDELGRYDPGLLIWGGEQYELSFKIWMCGGRMVDAPCSRIGHVYRGEAHFPDSGFGNFLARNYRRLMDVWMDEYAEFVYQRRPHFRDTDPGDLTAQHAIRKRLKCKSFKWFMTNVAFDLTQRYPTVDPIPSVSGQLRLKRDPSLCLSANGGKIIALLKCNSVGSRTHFEFGWHEDISIKGSDDCLDVISAGNRGPISLFGCHGHKGNQGWKLLFPSGVDTNPVILQHVGHNVCLEGDSEKLLAFVNPCDESSLNQQWTWDLLQRQKALKQYRELNIQL